MSERKPNQLARGAAVLALVVAFALVAVTIGNSGDGSGSSGESDARSGQTEQAQEPTRRGRQALQRGFIVVKQGDTLAQIASEAGLELEALVELNPQLDPQALTPGDRVRLR